MKVSLVCKKWNAVIGGSFLMRKLTLYYNDPQLLHYERRHEIGENFQSYRKHFNIKVKFCSDYEKVEWFLSRCNLCRVENFRVKSDEPVTVKSEVLLKLFLKIPSLKNLAIMVRLDDALVSNATPIRMRFLTELVLQNNNVDALTFFNAQQITSLAVTFFIRDWWRTEVTKRFVNFLKAAVNLKKLILQPAAFVAIFEEKNEFPYRNPS